jgi:hypothetical protein
MRPLALDMWLEHDHRRTSTGLHTRGAWGSGLGGRICMPRCPCRDSVWHDIAVSILTSYVQ